MRSLPARPRLHIMNVPRQISQYNEHKRVAFSRAALLIILGFGLAGCADDDAPRYGRYYRGYPAYRSYRYEDQGRCDRSYDGENPRRYEEEDEYEGR